MIRRQLQANIKLSYSILWGPPLRAAKFVYGVRRVSFHGRLDPNGIYFAILQLGSSQLRAGVNVIQVVEAIIGQCRMFVYMFSVTVYRAYRNDINEGLPHGRR